MLPRSLPLPERPTESFFLWGPRQVGAEHLRGLGAFAEDHPEVRRRIVVCNEPKRRKLSSGIEIVPVKTFLQELWKGAVA